MKNILIKFALMSCISIVLLGTIEYRSRNMDNSRLKKVKDRIDSLGVENIDAFALGPSHLNRSFNPEYMTDNVVSFGMGGSSINVDYLFWNAIVKQYEPKYLIMEFSKGYLDHYNSERWIRSKKIPYYFDVDVDFAIRDLFLTQYPLWRFITGKAFKRNFNSHGFEMNINKGKNLFAKLDYSEQKITTSDELAKVFSKHNVEYESRNKKNRKMLREMIEYASNNGIQVFIYSAPKYHSYNSGISQYHTDQRDGFIRSIQDLPNITFWNFEDLYEHDEDEERSFFNYNHMHPNAAPKFSMMLDSLIQIELAKQ